MNFPHFLIPWFDQRQKQWKYQRKHHKLTNHPSTTTVSMTKNIILFFVYPANIILLQQTNHSHPIPTQKPSYRHPPIHKQQNQEKKVFKKQFLFSSIFFHFHFNTIFILFSSVFPDGRRRLVLIVLDGLNTNKWLQNNSLENIMKVLWFNLMRFECKDMQATKAMRYIYYTATESTNFAYVCMFIVCLHFPKKPYWKIFL